MFATNKRLRRQRDDARIAWHACSNRLRQVLRQKEALKAKLLTAESDRDDGVEEINKLWELVRNLRPGEE